jgi:hypothetical protein
MSVQTTSKDTHNAISSLESVAGATPCASPDGPMTDLFGREVAPASHLPRQVKERANRMSATYGRIGQGSSASAALQKSLESKLMMQLPQAGSMTSFMTWRRKRTPALRRYCQLVVSGRRMSVNGFGFLPTIAAQCQQGGLRLGGGSAATKKWKKLLSTVTKRDERMDNWTPAYERRKSPSIDAISSKHGRTGMVDLLALAAWMMGYPRHWLNQLWLASAMPSSRRSRRSSSKPAGSASHES